MQQHQPAPFRVLKFWPTYVAKPDGTMREVDMVSYCPIGMADKHVCVEAVSRLSKLRPLSAGSNDESSKMAHLRWSVIEPAYRAWKSGQEIPLNGTPLGAWPQVTAEQADVMRTHGLRTIEEVAAVTDEILSKLPLPNARDLRSVAEMYLRSRSGAAASAQMAEMKAQNDVLKEQLEELRQMLVAQHDTEAPARRRGRPPKVEAETEDAA